MARHGALVCVVGSSGLARQVVSPCGTLEPLWFSVVQRADSCYASTSLIIRKNCMAVGRKSCFETEVTENVPLNGIYFSIKQSFTS